MLAIELRAGMAIRSEGRAYKLVEVELKSRAGQIHNLVKIKLRDLDTGRLSELHVRPEERFEDLELDRQSMEFLYGDAESCTFMHPETFEQIVIPRSTIGPGERFLQEGMKLPVELFEGRPVSIVLPQTVDLAVTQTAPAVHSQQDSTLKEATLENGVVIKVPLFVEAGETVRVEVETGRYIERIRTDRKRGA
jgi:elongation factor P